MVFLFLSLPLSLKPINHDNLMCGEVKTLRTSKQHNFSDVKQKMENLPLIKKRSEANDGPYFTCAAAGTGVIITRGGGGE